MGGLENYGGFIWEFTKTLGAREREMTNMGSVPKTFSSNNTPAKMGKLVKMFWRHSSTDLGVILAISREYVLSAAALENVRVFMVLIPAVKRRCECDRNSDPNKTPKNTK